MKRHLLAIVLLFAVSGSVSVQAQSKEASDSGEALDVSYFDVNTGQEVPLTPQQISRVPEEANLFTPRATNNMMDGYMQFHIGIARRV